MNTTKLAILTSLGLQPVLVIDTKSHLAIGRIVTSLKQMRSGLWPKHEGDTTITVTATPGKEYELYKLSWSLPEKGYKLQETPAHKALDEIRAQRKAQIQERAAQAAIPPMAFAAKRFSFRPHPLGVRVTFATQSSFVAWANGHGISFTHLGKHHAIIPHIPQGCTLKFDRTPKCPWVQPPVPTTPDPEPTPETKPTSAWTRDQIKNWLNDQGIDTLGLSKKADLLELVQEVH